MLGHLLGWIDAIHMVFEWRRKADEHLFGASHNRFYQQLQALFYATDDCEFAISIAKPAIGRVGQIRHAVLLCGCVCLFAVSEGLKFFVAGAHGLSRLTAHSSGPIRPACLRSSQFSTTAIVQ